MPKYYDFKVGNYYLYFTSACIIEAFHVHASDTKLTEAGSAKFFVYENGDTKVANRGRLSNKSIAIIQAFIKANYQDMHDKWKSFDASAGEYYTKK